MKKLIITSIYGVTLVVIGIIAASISYPELKCVNNLAAALILVMIPVILIICGIYMCFISRDAMINYRIK